MNSDGIVLLERVLAGDKEIMRLIDKCAIYARTKKELELIEYRKQLSGNKVYADVVAVHLLQRLLNNLT